MKYARHGFTLVEVIIVIVVIAILATITTLGLTQVQGDARDSVRSTSTLSLADALEKYYDKNGEYPSCAMVTGSAANVSALLSVDVSVLQAPQSTADNSYTCTELTTGGGDDEFAYVGDGSTTCATGGSCLQWEIQYRTEGGEIKTIQSRRSASLATSGAPNVSLTVASNTQINITWTPVSNAVSYLVERSTSSSLSSPVTQSVTGTSFSATSLNPGERYYIRVTPQLPSQAGQASAVENAVTTISAPSGTVVVAASLQTSDTEARGTASGVTCASGTTLQYSLGSQGRNTNSTVSITYGTWGTGTTRTVSASQGYNYTFQAKARCVGSDATSSEITSSTASITRGINKPAMPTYTGDTTFRAGYRYNMTYTSSCPAGTWVDGSILLYNRGYSETAWYPGPSSAGAVDTPWGRFYTVPMVEWWYLGWAAGQVWEDVNYYAFYWCKTDFATSSHTDHRHTYVTVECESGRRSYSGNPRCDYYGQSSGSLPWGP